MRDQEIRRLVERYGQHWREARDADGFRIAPADAEPGSIGALREELEDIIGGLILAAAALWPLWLATAYAR